MYHLAHSEESVYTPRAREGSAPAMDRVRESADDSNLAQLLQLPHMRGFAGDSEVAMTEQERDVYIRLTKEQPTVDRTESVERLAPYFEKHGHF
mgnify:CR=1 FL=1